MSDPVRGVATPTVGWPPVHDGARPRTWVEIDGEALRANTVAARELAGERGLLAVLKADAYGHGAVAVAPVVRAAGADWIGVGDSNEAIRLRDAGDQGPLLILGAIVPTEIERVVRYRITPVIHSVRRLDDLAREGERQGEVVTVHIKVDTGMARLGMRTARIEAAVARIAESPWLRLGGVMSHLAGSGDDLRGRRSQELRFARAVARVRRAGAAPSERHLRNSVGLLHPASGPCEETLVRCGALLFGFDPPGCELPEGFRPVLSWHAQIAFVKDVPAGTRVGYEGSFTCPRRTRLAVIPVGYHDGLPRLSGEGAAVLVRGRRAPLVGRVSMDYATLDVTDVPDVGPGDRVTIIGRDGEHVLRIEDLGRVTGRIPHELLSGLGPRVVRLRRAAVEASHR